MDALLQVHGAKRVFPIPEGLKELSSDIIREVLRHQPECIHAFIAEYLETMLLLREKARGEYGRTKGNFNGDCNGGLIYRIHGARKRRVPAGLLPRRAIQNEESHHGNGK